jgi:hypothetical protein
MKSDKCLTDADGCVLQIGDKVRAALTRFDGPGHLFGERKATTYSTRADFPSRVRRWLTPEETEQAIRDDKAAKEMG